MNITKILLIIYLNKLFVMKYCDFEEILSEDRMRRYVKACGGNKKKGMTLYRYNLNLAGEMLKIISCFEVALRNRIDQILNPVFGKDWLRDSCMPQGIFDSPRTTGTQKIILRAYTDLENKGAYTPTKLMAEMEFGVWKYMYSGPQYAATLQKLLAVFPNKPKSSASARIDNKYIFNELDRINLIRNRIAHHEPICFAANLPLLSLNYIDTVYQRILELFSWMGINGRKLLYGIDHIPKIREEIISKHLSPEINQ